MILNCCAIHNTPLPPRPNRLSLISLTVPFLPSNHLDHTFPLPLGPREFIAGTLYMVERCEDPGFFEIGYTAQIADNRIAYLQPCTSMPCRRHWPQNTPVCASAIMVEVCLLLSLQLTYPRKLGFCTITSLALREHLCLTTKCST